MRRTWLATIAGLAVAGSAAAQDVMRIPPGAVARKADHLDHLSRLDHLYQGGRRTGSERTEHFSRKYRIAPDGRVSLTNIAGEITVTGGSGDEVSIEAIKRARGDRDALSSVRIEVDNSPARVDVRTIHSERNDRVSVDYTVTMPEGAALEVHSVSGSIKVTRIHGSTRAETVSGSITASDTPRLTLAKSVSGNVSIAGVTEGDLSAGSVSGNISAKSVKVHSLDLSSVSGDLELAEITCERLAAKSVSGGVEYGGTISRGGSYDFNVHSGSIRLLLATPAGFVLNANSFSGTIRSDLTLTIGGDASPTIRDRRRHRDVLGAHSIHATYGDGSARVTARTFSGDIIISKR